jgi:hypothetical protein
VCDESEESIAETDERSEWSASRGTKVPDLPAMLSAIAWSFQEERPVPYTVAPIDSRVSASWSPIPFVAPVIITLVPFMASSARMGVVASRANPAVEEASRW